MSIKAKEAARRKRQNEKLRKMVEDARKDIAGHEELAKIHTAYVGVLLNKLGATKESPVTITNEEVREALAKCDVRATVADSCAWNLYCEVKD